MDLVIGKENFFGSIGLRVSLVPRKHGLYDEAVPTTGQASTSDKYLLVIPAAPLWSSGQSFWLQIQRSRVRFPALQDFLCGSGSGTGCTQPREVN